MQLIPRYLVNNKSIIIANEAGFVTEYRPVYQRHIQVYKGIDNILQFKLLNADQKPIDLTVKGYTPKFQAFDENKNLIIEHDGVVVTGDDSSSTRGLFKVTVSDNDLLNIKQQYLSYNIHLVDSNNASVLTYTDEHFGNNGTIFVSSAAFPGPKDTWSISTFLEDNGLAGDLNDNVWRSETVSAEPGINGNEALHTAVVYTDNYVGDIIIQGTLDNQVLADNTNDWADIKTLSFTGSETEPTSANFYGVFNHLRFVATADPDSKITKILLRN
jgi:hypothetical protein